MDEGQREADVEFSRSNTTKMKIGRSYSVSNPKETKMFMAALTVLYGHRNLGLIRLPPEEVSRGMDSFSRKKLHQEQWVVRRM